MQSRKRALVRVQRHSLTGGRSGGFEKTCWVWCSGLDERVMRKGEEDWRTESFHRSEIDSSFSVS